MAAHACCDGVVAGAAPAAASRRLKLRRPSRSSLVRKARKLRKAGGGGGERLGPAASRKRRVMVIRSKMEALRRLVPVCGGDVEERVDGRLEELLLHAAVYIVRLQMQVRVMQVMVHALNSTED